jgi:hypothetical protein
VRAVKEYHPISPLPLSMEGILPYIIDERQVEYSSSADG